jgi:hypothetical protein
VSETTSLKDALTAAEAELDTIAAQVKEAYRRYKTEVRELCRQIREEEQR